LARRQHMSSRRRGMTARCGEVDGAAAMFALARVYGGTQTLGAYAHDTGEAKASQRLGLSPLARSRSAARPWRSSGWCSRRQKETRCSRPAATYGSMWPRRRRGRTEDPKSLTLSPARVCTKATRVAKAAAARRAGRRGVQRNERKPRTRPWTPRKCARVHNHAMACTTS
jgi:hypothetical protein